MTTTEPLTMQRYFTETVEYLRGQKQMSAAAQGQPGTCVYRTLDGNNCAVGYWIPDAHKAQEVLGCVQSLYHYYPELTGVAWPDEEYGLTLAGQLQILHDSTHFRHGSNFGGLSVEGEAEVKDMAARFDLEYPLPAVPVEDRELVTA